MLKSVLLFFVFALSYMPFASAQKISLGPMIGANFANISDIPDSKVKTGLNAGLFLNYSVNENLGLGIKAMYSQLGAKDVSGTGETHLNYVQIPLSGIYYFGERGNTIRPKVFLGPYVGFLLNARDQNGNDIKSPSGQDFFNKTDVGGQVGLGFNYSLANLSWINFDAGYSTSLVNITDHSDRDYKNSAFFASVGYSFPISQ
jgi:outer membrane protein W